MSEIEIIIFGYICGFFFIACCYFIKGLYEIYKKVLNKENIL